MTMTGERRLHCWIAAWFIGVTFNPTEAAGGSFGQTSVGEDCIPPTDSSAPVGLRGYRRYFANDSLIGRPVTCTRDDKICFRHNLVYDPSTDRCKALLEDCGIYNKFRIAIKKEPEREFDHVVGYCPEHLDPCPGYRMAYDGVCYGKKIVREVICGCGAMHSAHILGGVECRVEPISPMSVQQPEEDGSCVIPILHNPDPRRSMLLVDFFREEYRKELKCRSDQASCFSAGHVFVQEYEGCHLLLQQGPCAEDHVVALDLQAATEGRAEGTCVHVRGGCPKGHKRMLFDGQCHEDREMKLVSPGVIVWDVFGRYFSVRYRPRIVLPIANGNRSCTIASPILRTTSINRAFPLCGITNSGVCKLYEVENSRSKPDVHDRK